MNDAAICALCILAAGCNATTLETPRGTPGDVAAESEVAHGPSPVLEKDFDPLEAYASDTRAGVQAGHHMHHNMAHGAAEADAAATPAESGDAGSMPNHQKAPPKSEAIPKHDGTSHAPPGAT